MKFRANILSCSVCRTQANYVVWRGAAASVMYMNEAARKLQLDYITAMTGKGEREPRWKECVGVVSAR